MRKPNWPEILAAKIEAARNTPFSWGTHDCCMFSADVVLAMTGTDYAEEFRGKYTTATGATKALKKYGLGSIENSLTVKFGEPVHPFKAGRGDVVLADMPTGKALGICLGEKAAFAGKDGMVLLPMNLWLCAWRVF